MAFDPNEWEVVGPTQPQQQPQFNPSDWEVVPQQPQTPQPTPDQLIGEDATPVQRFGRAMVGGLERIVPGMDRMVAYASTPIDVARSVYQGHNQGMTWEDAINQVMPQAGSIYAQRLKEQQDYKQAVRQRAGEVTGTNAFLDVGSGMLLPLNAAQKALGVNPEALGTAGRAAFNAVTGAGIGAGYNALEQPDLTNLDLSSVEQAAKYGGLLGAGGSALGDFVSSVLGSTANRMGRSADAARMEFLGSREKDVVDSFKKGVTYLDESGNAVPAGSATEVTNKLQQDYQLLKDQGFFKGLPSDPSKALIRSNARQGALGSDINDIVQTADQVLAGKRVQFDPTAVKDQLRTISAEQATAVPREGFQDAQTLAEDLLRQSRQGASASRQTLSNLQGQYEAASSDLRAARAQYEALDSQYAQALTDAQALQGTAKAAAMRQAHATYAEPWANAQEALSSLADRESGLFKQIQRTQKALTRNVGAEAEAQGYTAELGAEARTLAEKQQALADQEAALRGGYKDAWKGFDPRFDTARGYAKDVGLANPSRGKALLSELRDVRNNWADSNRTVGDAMRFKRSAGNQPRIFGASASALEGDSAQLKRFIYGSFADSAKRGINQHLGPDAVNAFSKANREISALKNFEEGLIRQTAKGSGIAGGIKKLGLADYLKLAGAGAVVGSSSPPLAAALVAAKVLKTAKPLGYANLIESLASVPRSASSAVGAVAPRSGLIAASLYRQERDQGPKGTTQAPKSLRSQYTYAPPSVPRISYDPTPANSREQAGGSYQDLVRKIEPALVKVESGGNPLAESSKGAIGTHQVTPIAARDVMRADGIDDRQFSDAQIKQILRQEGMSAYFGRKYLALMLSRFGGNPQLAEAAYNGGPSRLDRRGRNIDAMPAETRAYVRKLAALA